MLDTRFPRLPGDVGHPETFAWPVCQVVVAGAVPRAIVTDAAALRASPLVPAFVAALRSLQEAGARALTTSCGFLVLLQEELQAQLRVPLVTSSLLQLPALLGARQRVGVLTISADTLSGDHLRAAGVPAQRMHDVVIGGVDPAGEFAQGILGNRDTLDVTRAQAGVVDAALALRARAPELTDVVLECTNLPPYADAIRAATGWTLHTLQDDPLWRSVFPVRG